LVPVVSGHTAQTPFKVTLKKNDDIADLMDAVKIKCGDNLQGVSSAQLRVYPPGTQVPVPEGADDPTLDPGGLVVHLNWGTSSKNAFVIVAPDIGTCFDLMEYLLLYCRSQLLILTYHFVSFIPYKYSLLLKRPRNDETPETK
jgi:hypothetical protein